MPITQSRMLALLNSALAYRAAFNTASKSIAEAHRRVLQGADAAQELALLSQLLPPTAVTDYPNAEATVLVEYNHFSRNAARNNRARQRMANTRGAPQREQRNRLAPDISTILPARRTSAPASLAPDIEVLDVAAAARALEQGDELPLTRNIADEGQRLRPIVRAQGEQYTLDDLKALAAEGNDDNGATLPPGEALAEDDNAPGASLDPRARHAALALLEGHGPNSANPGRCRCGHEGALQAHLESVGAAIAARGQ